MIDADMSTVQQLGDVARRIESRSSFVLSKTTLALIRGEQIEISVRKMTPATIDARERMTKVLDSFFKTAKSTIIERLTKRVRARKVLGNLGRLQKTDDDPDQYTQIDWSIASAGDSRRTALSRTRRRRARLRATRHRRREHDRRVERSSGGMERRARGRACWNEVRQR